MAPQPPCTGCGRLDVETVHFICHWPDQRVTHERHCPECQHTWQKQLRAVGARLEVSPPDDAPKTHPA